MKSIISIIALLLFLGCSEKEKFKFDYAKSNLNFINKANDSLFDFENDKIYKEIINYESLIKSKVDSNMQNILREKIKDSIELFYYSQISREKLVLLVYEDYYKDFLIVTFKNSEICELKTIATITGDGGDFYIKSARLEKTFYKSYFREGYRSFSEPDTIYYTYKGVSKIYFDCDDIIHEDTLSVKKDFKYLSP